MGFLEDFISDEMKKALVPAQRYILLDIAVVTVGLGATWYSQKDSLPAQDACQGAYTAVLAMLLVNGCSILLNLILQLITGCSETIELQEGEELVGSMLASMLVRTLLGVGVVGFCGFSSFHGACDMLQYCTLACAMVMALSPVIFLIQLRSELKEAKRHAEKQMRTCGLAALTG
eukprot:TRINITY_DN95159_c0_g1_i1.p1 TRINITY_DN95159_c0_g1~~TRINITY_DN95159_c0_g1_i1.p1  ORF type:complete len:175 (+),score=29.25 TRINITY_DN95159_c0_g1_i1:193-717(+)